MLAPGDYFHKLWDKGVDIGAGVVISSVSGLILAAIATLTWRWKRRRDIKLEEDKQRQQHRIAQEFAQQEQRERGIQLKRERDALIQKVLDTQGNAQQLQKAWDAWETWLRKNGLEYLPGNRKILDKWATHSHAFGATSRQDTVFKWAEQIAEDIKNTQFNS